ncbi:MAG: M12 family metallopeptidase [Phycisphaerales bacterium]
MRTNMQTLRVAVLLLGAASMTANAQVLRNGVWQGSDAQKGNPHGLATEVLHRPPAACTALPSLARGVFRDATWPDNVIPFAFSGNVTLSNQLAMLNAMGELTRVADVKFIERTDQSDYIFIQDSDVNNSFVGRVGGEQIINIFNWNFEFIMVHELMHAIGVWHEQSANDRDTFVTVLEQNIRPGQEHNFAIQADANVTPLYDYMSVMHYGQYTFSIDPGNLRTIVTTDPTQQDVIGQREFISSQDEVGLEMMLGDTPLQEWLSVDYVNLPFLPTGRFENPWEDLRTAVIAASPIGTRIVNIRPRVDTGSASPSSPLVINKFVRIEGATLVID